MPKEINLLGIDVYTAAKLRIAWTFDNFEKICVSFSGGKDSTAMAHIVMEEARRRNRKVALLFIDWEIQYKMTIDHVKRVYDMYSDIIVPYWISLPLLTDNACSQYEPEWICWDKDKKDSWVRQPEKISITDESFFPFYYYKITFEEFVPKFAEWYGENKKTACFIGIRTRESLNRWRACTNSRKGMFDDKLFTTCVTNDVYNVYPIYDWKAEDDWTYFGKYHKCYNEIYDQFYKAGLTLHQMRVDEPFGDTTRRSLWMYQVIEPLTWAKMVIRVSGANCGNLYCKEKGNIMGNSNITLPSRFNTWQEFAEYLLSTMPEKVMEHYKCKIAVYIKWYMNRGYSDGISDVADRNMEIKKDVPSWCRICRTLLRNDYWCKQLGFSPQKQSAYDRYIERIKSKRTEWGILSE